MGDTNDVIKLFIEQDELSGMTYLSYFMKEEDSPGYYATLDWVKKQIPNHRINNFRVSKKCS